MFWVAAARFAGAVPKLAIEHRGGTTRELHGSFDFARSHSSIEAWGCECWSAIGPRQEEERIDQEIRGGMSFVVNPAVKSLS
jgi:hypothetical protein